MAVSKNIWKGKNWVATWPGNIYLENQSSQENMATKILYATLGKLQYFYATLFWAC